jgi:uncharacterized protein (TIRG00374 family)
VQTRTRIALGVGVTVVIFGLLILFVGVERFVETITSVDPLYVAAILAVILVRRTCQGGILYVAFNRFDVRITLLASVFLSASTTFVKNAVPFGQLGGEPVAAGVVTESVDAPYEECLAALSTVETIRFIPSTTVFLGGSLYFVFFPTSVPPIIEPLFGVFGLLLFVLAVLAVVVWKFQGPAEAYVARTLYRASAVLTVVPLVARPDEETVRDRVEAFGTLFVDLTTDRWLVAGVATLSFGNTFFTVLELWIALRAVGLSVPFPIVLFAVPFSQLASILPSPGGVGGIEGVLVLFVTALTASAVRDVTTGVILFSGLGYWMTILIGGVGLSVALPLLTGE